MFENFDFSQLDNLEDLLVANDRWYWTEKNRYLKGQPWSFQGRPYLKEIYRTNKKNLVFVKGRQVEASELSINLTLHFLLTNPSTTALYTLPSTDLCQVFSGKRFEDAIVESIPIKKQLIGDGSVGHRKFKNGSHLYVRTSSSGGDKARSLDGDFLICDEYQDFDARGIIEVPARDVLLSNLDHSSHKLNITFGTPKLSGTHFEELWDASSKKHWHITCDYCQFEQYMTLDNIINFDKGYENDDFDIVFFGCKACQHPIDRTDGVWIPTNNKPSELEGFHISQLITPWKKAEDILRAHGTKHIKGKSKRGFFNEVLGYFYAGSDQPFNEENLVRCYRTDLGLLNSSGDSCYMGVDWGDTSTVCIIEYNRETDSAKIVYAGKFSQKEHIEQANRIADLFPRYAIRNAVVDKGYGVAQWQEMLKRFPGRVYAATYSYDSKAQDSLLDWDHKECRVSIERDLAISALIDRVDRGCDENSGLIIPWNEEASHRLSEPFLREMKQVTAEVKNNRTQYGRFGSGDHFMHALLYAITAAQCDTARTSKTKTVTIGYNSGRNRSHFRPY